MNNTNAKKYTLLTRSPQLIRLRDRFGRHNVIVYRDDPDDFALGGNKVRFYEYLIPRITASAPDVIVSSGSIYSNHIRVTAAVCSKLGIRCELLITDDAPADGAALTPNLALAASYGASLHYIGAFAALLKIREFVTGLESRGDKVFLVPNGGHTAEALPAYSDVLEYAVNELSNRGIVPDSIFLPCASGTTHAGLLYGKSRLNLNAPVVSFAVANTTRGGTRGISRLISSAASLYPDAAGAQALNVQVLDCGKNNYGNPDDELSALRDEIYRTDGILLDRVYNINAFYGMTRNLSANAGEGTALYIDTGGYCL